MKNLTKCANEMVDVMFDNGFTVSKQTYEDLCSFLMHRSGDVFTSTPTDAVYIGDDPNAPKNVC